VEQTQTPPQSSAPTRAPHEELWPALSLANWRDSYLTLHLWTQILGKIRLALTPLVNHWWNCTLLLSGHGLTTSAIPYGEGAFELRFDFVEHQLILEPSWRPPTTIDLRPQPTADFYREVFDALKASGIKVRIWPVTVEMPERIHLDVDRAHQAYVREDIERWWRAMLTVDSVFTEFRARFLGKSSPVHFFWGSFDLAVSRYSGQRAPPRPELDRVSAEAYSHEVMSAGFWPGSFNVNDAAFYAYAAPQPKGYEQALVKPAAAHYDRQLGEFVLMYEDVRTSPSPRQTLLDFLQSTYEAGANLAGWNRAELERNPDAASTVHAS
jgi:hypothetical protein